MPLSSPEGCTERLESVRAKWALLKPQKPERGLNKVSSGEREGLWHPAKLYVK